MKNLAWFVVGMFVGEIGLRWIERAVYGSIISALLLALYAR